MKMLRLLYGVLDTQARRGLLLLAPLMVLASAADLLVVGLGTAFVATVVNPEGVLASGVGSKIHAVVGGGESQVLLVFGVVTIACTLLGNLGSIVANWYLALYGSREASRLGARLLESYLQRPYAWFLVADPAALSNRVLREVQQVLGVVLLGILRVASRVLSVIAIVIVLVTYDPGMSLVLFGTFGGLYGVSYGLLRGYNRRLGKRRLGLQRNLHHLALESLEGVKEIQIYGLENDIGDQYRSVGEDMAQVSARFTAIAGSMRYLIEIVAITSMVFVSLFYSFQGRPLLDLVPVLGAYGIAILRLLPVLQLFFLTASRAQFQLDALIAVHEDSLWKPPERVEGGVEPLPFEKRLSIDAGTYVYPSGGKPVFEHLSMHVDKGEWIALVGTTGAGKSTLVNTLIGLLELESGSVDVDGVRVDVDNRARWNASLAYVPQSIFIRLGTLEENIRFTGDVSREDLEWASRIAQLHDVAMNDFEDGYETQVGTRGSRMSGGQAQRVGLARAIARKPSLLILDEATSALDNETEAAVVSGLREHLSDTTVVMIAHRLSSTRHCDRILVLEHGSIVQEGSFDTLSATEGRFRDMLRAGAVSG